MNIYKLDPDTGVLNVVKPDGTEAVITAEDTDSVRPTSIAWGKHLS
jgi:hypothetical protein